MLTARDIEGRAEATTLNRGSSPLESSWRFDEVERRLSAALLPLPRLAVLLLLLLLLLFCSFSASHRLLMTQLYSSSPEQSCVKKERSLSARSTFDATDSRGESLGTPRQDSSTCAVSRKSSVLMLLLMGNDGTDDDDDDDDVTAAEFERASKSAFDGEDDDDGVGGQ